MSRNKTVCVVLLMMLCPLVAHASSFLDAPSPAPADTSAYSKYSFVRFLEERDSVNLTDDEFYDIAGRVVFPINKYELPKRDSLVMLLQREVFPLINRDSLQLASLLIRGAASPEGPYRFNKYLGERRAQSLVDFLRKNIEQPIDPNAFELEIDIEDYRTLCIMMHRASDKDYAVVQTLCDRYLPKGQVQKLKQQLRTMRQGTLWRRLFREYFPRLRAARVVFFFRAPITNAKRVQPDLDLKDITVLPPLSVDTAQTIAPVDRPVVVAPVVEPAPVQPVVVDSQPALIRPQLRLPRRELLSVKSNLLFDFAYVPGYDRWCPIPNVAVEYYPKRGHFTVGASMDFPWWQHHADHKFFEIRNYQLETRYYLRSGDIANNPPGEGMAFRGLYFSGYVHAGLYSICFDEDHGWEGEGFGGGFGLGYVMRLGKSKTSRWRLEFNAQLGIFVTRYDPYVYEHPIYTDYHDDRYYYNWIYDPDNFKRRAHRFTWFGPTRVGVTLSYDLLYRRNEQRGISINRWEYQDQPSQPSAEIQPTQYVEPLQTSQQ